MTLRTAPCPNCQGFVVFGERACRRCHTPFDYGPTPPAVPSAEQVNEALAAAGAPPEAVMPTAAGAVRSSPPAPTTATGPAIPMMEGLDTGRYDVGEVTPQQVPGLIDSTLFASMVPERIDVVPMPELEPTHLEVAGIVHVMPTPDLEVLDRSAVPDAPVALLPDLMDNSAGGRGVDVVAGADQSADLDVLPSAFHVKSHRGVDSEPLSRAACASCGEIHSVARCPACGTPHAGAGH